MVFNCPVWATQKNLLVKEIKFQTKDIVALDDFNTKSFKSALISIVCSLRNLKVIYQSMKHADHIHLRCPGNMGLLGCLVQILFPNIPKTAKYAGNWDPKAKQPWSYNLQKWILSNTFLSKNIKVLAYGKWPNQSTNVIPFFTASYYRSEIEPLYVRNYTKPLHFCFVGSLSVGKQPGLALDFVHQLRKNGKESIIHFYGDGILKEELENKIKDLNAQDWAFIYGNQPKKQIKKALKYSHFLILISKSEGWPKAVAEAMFWGCIPVASNVSCVPWMIDHGKRGFVVSENDIRNNFQGFQKMFNQPKALEQKSRLAADWSRQFTLDKFKQNISELL
jgi:glycosyltransferase involved in cell wall biosynthesis